MESTVSNLCKLNNTIQIMKRVFQKGNNGSHNMPSKSTVSQISKFEKKTKKRKEQEKDNDNKRQTTNRQKQI